MQLALIVATNPIAKPIPELGWPPLSGVLRDGAGSSVERHATTDFVFRRLVMLYDMTPVAEHQGEARGHRDVASRRSRASDCVDLPASVN